MRSFITLKNAIPITYAVHYALSIEQNTGVLNNYYEINQRNTNNANAWNAILLSKIVAELI